MNILYKVLATTRNMMLVQLESTSSNLISPTPISGEFHICSGCTENSNHLGDIFVRDVTLCPGGGDCMMCRESVA